MRAAALLTASSALLATNQALAEDVGGGAAAIWWADPLSMALGAVVLASVLVPALLWLRLRLNRVGQNAALAEMQAEALRECLATSPDGYACWHDDFTCSRRLAVLLGLPKGMESSAADVLAAFEPGDSLRLEQAVDRLRQDGDSFEMDVTLDQSTRRIRAMGTRAANPAGDMLADLVWFRDVSDSAGAVDDLARSLHALAADATYLKALIDALPMPVWLRDEDLSVLMVNQAYARAVEAASPEAALHDQVELAADDTVREARALAARARASGEPRSAEFHLVLAGARRLAHVTEIPISVGDSLLTVGLVQDHTRIEELQEQLAHHVSAQVEVLERLSTAIAIYTTDTRLAFFNTAFLKLWRMERDWLESQPTYGAVMDSLRDRRLLPETADYRALKEEELKRFISLIEPIETLMHLPDGRTLRRVVSPHPYGGLIFTYEDFTDTLAMERSFNTAMAVQRATLDHLHEGLAVFGDDRRLKLSNPAFARMWGLSADDLTGEPHLNELVERLRPYFEGRPDRASTWAPARERLLSQVGDRQGGEWRLERQDGMILDCAAVPLPDGASLVAFLDVTDSARVERALIERNEALAAADALKSEFMSNVSAEVAKPLTTIIGFAEMLDSDYFGKLSKRQHDYMKGIVEAGNALKSLVSDILDLAAIEAGHLTLELDTVDVHPMLASVLALVRERVREKKQQLDFDCPLDIGWIVADQRRLRQVMFNLIGNAVKYTPNGGAITVSARRRDGEVALTVADTGPGIPPEDMERVFDSFVRTIHDGQDGAGLGLALVRRFVELHGGTVELESQPGQGTVVTVRLPAGAGE